jgi:hypothetical protein
MDAAGNAGENEFTWTVLKATTPWDQKFFTSI